MSRTRHHLISIAAATGMLAACAGEVIDSVPDTAAGSAQPHLSAGPGGSIVLSWLEPADAGVALRYSTFDGRTWSPAATVASGDSWFVNWADIPSVSPINDATWAAHWLVKKPGGIYTYDVYAAISNDSGVTWGEPFVVHNDNTDSEHGFVTLFPWDDDIGALWLDGRNTVSSGGHDAHAGGMTLRSARLSESGEFAQRVEVDGLICDCCSTDVAVTSNGPVAVYRDRTPNEIRDISVTRLADGKWLPGAPIANDDWEIAGCPVNGPAIDAHEDLVTVAWFTAPNDEPAVRVALSEDSGATFGSPIDIDVDAPLGRVDVIQLADGSSIVSWLATGDDRTAAVVARHVETDGSFGNEVSIVRTGAGRTSGFPQMMQSGDDLLFAWTDVSGDETRVQTRLVPISKFR